jgi:hypothetical protein
MKNETLHFDYSALEDRMSKLGHSYYSLAHELGITKTTVYNKMHGIGRGGWTSAEMYRLCKILNIPDEEIAHYFLRPLK